MRKMDSTAKHHFLTNTSSISAVLIIIHIGSEDES